MDSRLIDTDKLIDVLLHERDVVFDSCDNETEKCAKFEGTSDCIGIVNHFPEYSEKEDCPVLTVSDVIYRFLSTSDVHVVLKRGDNGREYRKIRNSMDDKNDWEVTGFYPRIRTNGALHANVELVLWCQERGSAIMNLHDQVMCDHVIDKFGAGPREETDEHF